MTEVGNLYIGCRLDDNGACLLTQSTGNVCTHINTQFGARDAGRGMELKLNERPREARDCHLLVVLFAHNAHQFTNAILSQWRRLPL